MIRALLIAIVVVLALGIVFKLLKYAIVVALALGGFVLVRNFITSKRLR